MITFQIFTTTEKYRLVSFIWSHFLFMTFRVLKINGARNLSFRSYSSSKHFVKNVLLTLKLIWIMKGWWNGPEIILWLVIVTRSCTFISTAQLPVFITSCWESFQDSNSWKLAWWHGMFNLYPINFDRKSKNLNIRSLFSNNLLLWERKETGETVCPNRGKWNFTEALREFNQNWPKKRAAYFATLLVCVFFKEAT